MQVRALGSSFEGTALDEALESTLDVSKAGAGHPGTRAPSPFVESGPAPPEVGNGSFAMNRLGGFFAFSQGLLGLTNFLPTDLGFSALNH